MSELVVDGTCLVAFLVSKDEGDQGALVRLVKDGNCFVSYLKYLEVAS